ncbi:hypothetical protein [Archaeoglobus veneficus]|uniref:Uncharacterized protein n=1 Tax=Archaeoglobus veneficus (strain DSM 11195 / SNP6) TaxID=693661 RepID=F2KRM1_ARCVS|nr:hypothetical protein [Archaeoglobus veneficus]AEA46786.1 hypothetical protein Arcve_0770 [Archaeoglobus veneficus SNP6]
MVDMTRVKVMNPIFKPDDARTFVLYPYRIFHIRLYFKRIAGRDKELDYYAYVDCYRFGVERGDDFIELHEWDVPNDVVMDELVGREDARKKAMESAFLWGNMRVISWWTPRTDILREEKAYKVFWIFEEDGKKRIMDSLTGDVFDLQ